MASIGRGRGRGRGVFRSEEDKKLPDEESSPSPPKEKESEGPRPGGGGIDINQVSTLVQSLTLDADDISKDMVSSAVMKYADTESHVEEILRVLYIRILLDWRSARQMAYICARLVKLPKLGTTFRTSLVRRIQSDFTKRTSFQDDRESDRLEKPRTFLGCMAFLCQVLQQLRNTDGEPFRPLVTPVYLGLEMLLDDTASEREMEVAVTQLLDVGPLLHKLNNAPMEKLVKILRVKVLDATASREIRTKMLHLLEYNAGGWKLPSPDTKEEKQEKTDSKPTEKPPPSVKEDNGAVADTTKQSPKHSSPKRVSFSNITEVSTVSTNTYGTKPTYTTASDNDGWGSGGDFGGVWENPTDYSNENQKTFDYSWSSPPRDDNDAGQWEDVQHSSK